jgi:hypothetical protein
VQLALCRSTPQLNVLFECAQEGPKPANGLGPFRDSFFGLGRFGLRRFGLGRLRRIFRGADSLDEIQSRRHDIFASLMDASFQGSDKLSENYFGRLFEITRRFKNLFAGNVGAASCGIREFFGENTGFFLYQFEHKFQEAFVMA